MSTISSWGPTPAQLAAISSGQVNTASIAARLAAYNKLMSAIQTFRSAITGSASPSTAYSTLMAAEQTYDNTIASLNSPTPTPAPSTPASSPSTPIAHPSAPAPAPSTPTKPTASTTATKSPSQTPAPTFSPQAAQEIAQTENQMSALLTQVNGMLGNLSSSQSTSLNTTQLAEKVALTKKLQTVLTNISTYLNTKEPANPTPQQAENWANQALSNFKQVKQEVQSLYVQFQQHPSLFSQRELNLFSAVRRCVLGAAMGGVINHLAQANSLLKFENHVENSYLGVLMQSLWPVKNQKVSIAWPGDISVKNQTQEQHGWASFNSHLAAIKAEWGGSNASGMQWAARQSSLLKRFSAAARAAGNSSILHVATGLQAKLQAFKSAAIAMAHVSIQGSKILYNGQKISNTALQKKISAFNEAKGNFAAAVNADSASLSTASNQAQSNLQMQLSFFQEFYGITSTLLGMLISFSQQAVQHVGGQ